MDRPPGGYFAAYAEELRKNGYPFIPIKEREKYPGYPGWEKAAGSKAEIRAHLAAGRGKGGIGILTEHLPAIDIDCTDPGSADHMQRWIEEHIDWTLVRIGQAPKRLMVFRTDHPFRKMQAVFVDGAGVEQRIEILGSGQQFVALHIHPGTGKPYTWIGKDNPTNTPADTLPVLTAEMGQKVLQEFERYAKGRGWVAKSAALAVRPKVDDDDPFADVAPKANLSIQELRRLLALIPNDGGGQDYDTWLQVAAGVYHETDGSPEGLEAFLEWSARSNKHDDRESGRKWESLDIDGKGRAPVTARFILKLAKEASQAAAAAALGGVEDGIRAATTYEALKAACALAKRLELDPPQRAALVKQVQDRFKTLKGVPLPIREARDLVRYAAAKNPETPRWMEGYVFVSHDETFFHRTTRERLGLLSFNSRYSRELLTPQDRLEGRSTPTDRPSDVALNVYQVPTVSNVRYAPGEDDLFTQNGLSYVNAYTGQSVPPVPDKPTPADRANVERVKAHFEHLFPGERDRRIFMDWLAYIVQHHRRPNWAVMLQGVEGDGKSFFGVLMGAVLGMENVRVLQARTIEGAFNGWAEGQMLVVVEEIRLQGHNRHDVLNQVKPLITNSMIEIHRKGVDPYNVPNTSAYLLTSNFRDAMPLLETDSRYFVLASRFQTKEAIDEFKAEHPDYYADLYAAVDESAGALRGWLLGHPFGTDFKPQERAPRSSAKDYMVDLNKSDEQRAIEEVLEGSTDPELCGTLLNVAKLEQEANAPMPAGWILNRLLTSMGFTKLGRVKVKADYQYYWSRRPDKFIVDGKLSPTKIRDWVDPGL